eukprot:1192735-Ditylum_brightwellii.AAC.1
MKYLSPFHLRKLPLQGERGLRKETLVQCFARNILDPIQEFCEINMEAHRIPSLAKVYLAFY